MSESELATIGQLPLPESLASSWYWPAARPATLDGVESRARTDEKAIQRPHRIPQPAAELNLRSAILQWAIEQGAISSFGVTDLTALQRTAGNAATSRLIEGAPRPSIQTFDPRYHRTSVVEGLSGAGDQGFTPEEIGAIYAANWERDLSQTHPYLGAVILAWKKLKVAAYEQRLSDSELGEFDAAIQKVIEKATSRGGIDELKNTTTYGGYRYWEHMDNPTDAEAFGRPQPRLNPRGFHDIPLHLAISVEYVKTMLFDAAKGAHPDIAGFSALPAFGFEQMQANEKPKGERLDDKDAVKPDIVATETAYEVRQKEFSRGGPITLPAKPRLGPGVYEALGRASHALEDFWSHSNFVELAIGQVEFNLGGLTTATYQAEDQSHALAHKIRGACDEMTEEAALLDRVTGRTKGQVPPWDITLGSESMPSKEASPKGRTGRNVATGAAAVLTATDSGIKEAARQVLATMRGIELLRSIAEKIEESTRKTQLEAGKYGSHTLLAKDQPGHDDEAASALKTAKFEMAHALSVEADRLVIGAMPQVLSAPTGAEADKRLLAIYDVLDRLIRAPSENHPLASIVEKYRADAESALAAAQSGR